MANATIYKDSDVIDVTTPAAGYASGEIIQLADGRAAFVAGLTARTVGEVAGLKTSGQVTVAKTASIVILDGGEVKWDHSANSATIPLMVDDNDFIIGTAVGDAASAATTMVVDLNKRSTGIIKLQESAFAHVPVLTAGTPVGSMQGGSYRAAFSATAEAQKLDLISKRSFPLASNWILEAIVEVVVNADADVGDLSVGVANATHASDADSITESAFFHFDMGADLNLDAESDDGTVEVAATDTTVDWAVGTAIHLVIDGRDPTNCKYYVNGVEVLAATSNLGDIRLATGPLKALFHLEKSSNDSLGEVRLDKMEVRITPDI